MFPLTDMKTITDYSSRHVPDIICLAKIGFGWGGAKFWVPYELNPSLGDTAHFVSCNTCP